MSLEPYSQLFHNLLHFRTVQVMLSMVKRCQLEVTRMLFRPESSIQFNLLDLIANRIPSANFIDQNIMSAEVHKNGSQVEQDFALVHLNL